MDVLRRSFILLTCTVLAAAGLLSLTPVSAQGSGCVWNGDAVYVDVDFSGDVSPGDVRITPAQGLPAGSRVTGGGGTDLGAPANLLDNGNYNFRYLDMVGGGGYHRGDPILLDRTNGGVSIADILLTDVEFEGDGRQWHYPYGQVVGIGTYLPFGAFDFGFPWRGIDWFDEDNDGNVDLDEPVILAQDLDFVMSGDIILSGGASANSAVDGQPVAPSYGPTSGYRDLPLQNVDFNIIFVDFDSSGAFSHPGGDAWSCPEGEEPYEGYASQQAAAPDAGSDDGSSGDSTGSGDSETDGTGSDDLSSNDGRGGANTTLIIVLVAAAVLVGAYFMGAFSGKPK